MGSWYQQQTQPTCGAVSGNQTRATAVGSEHSHHCAVPASPKVCFRYFCFSWRETPCSWREAPCLFVKGGLERSNLGKIYRRRPRRYKFEFSIVGNDRRPSQKSGTRRENKNTPDSPDLFPFIPDDREYLLFRVFIKAWFSYVVWDFTVSRPSQILPTNENSKS